MAKTREQIAAQCRAVAHLARQIAIVHEEKGEVYGQIDMDPGLIEVVGHHTAGLMETLGDILNGMDAVTEEDAWLDPIFAEAQAAWPTARSAL